MQSSEITTKEDNWRSTPSRKGKKRFGLQIIYPMFGRNMIWNEWYFSERDRQTALNALENKSLMIFPNGKVLENKREYRKIER